MQINNEENNLIDNKQNDSKTSERVELGIEQEKSLEKNLVWIFASPRSGTTWLSNQLLRYQTLAMDEPYIGYHLASINFFQGNPKIHESHEKRNTYFFSKEYEDTWKFYLRKLILNRIYSQYRDLSHKIILKEPNGSHGADKIIHCLPSSKIILLMRDGRDVLDSMLDAMKKDGWSSHKRGYLREQNRIPRLKKLARQWKIRMKLLLDVYEKQPPDLRLKIKYEDLRSNTSDELQKIYEFIDVKISRDEIEKLVDKYKFENIPPDRRGSGKSKRFATPGKWEESFSEPEKKVLEELIGTFLKRLGYK